MKKRLLLLVVAASALTGCHQRRAETRILRFPPLAGLHTLLTKFVLDADGVPTAEGYKPALLADDLSEMITFLAASRSYDADARNIPAGQLTDGDREYMKSNALAFAEERASAAALLKLLQGWTEAAATVETAPETIPSVASTPRAGRAGLKAPPAPSPFALRLALPIRAPRLLSDKPASVAAALASTMKFLDDSRAYDAGMKKIPAEQLTDEDREYIKKNALWFAEDRERAVQLLGRLRAWTEAAATVETAPETAPAAP